MYNMMQMMQGLGYGMGSLSFVFWLTTVLVWVALGLSIVALWKWINKK